MFSRIASRTIRSASANRGGTSTLANASVIATRSSSITKSASRHACASPPLLQTPGGAPSERYRALMCRLRLARCRSKTAMYSASASELDEPGTPPGRPAQPRMLQIVNTRTRPTIGSGQPFQLDRAIPIPTLTLLCPRIVASQPTTLCALCRRCEPNRARVTAAPMPSRSGSQSNRA
jgi:hypothetical protein